MDNILVLGASGFIGHHLIERLMPDHHVIGYSRQAPNALLSNSNYVPIPGNFVTEQNF